MWSKQSQTEAPAAPPAQAPVSTVTPFSAPSSTRSNSPAARSSARLGSSMQIKGHITGDEDLQIDGIVDGPSSLRGHELSVGAGAQLNAEHPALQVVLSGTGV